VISIFSSSGSSGTPILWGDTLESWEWVTQCSQSLYVIAGIEPSDRILFFPTSGASSGRSIQQAGACSIGCTCLSGHSSPKAQLDSVQCSKANVLVGKPTQLLALVKAAQEAGLRPDSLGLSKLILTGEPCRQTIRPQLERLWAAECFDRYGLTEAGSVASECPAHCGGMHILESEFIAEVIRPETGLPAPEGEFGELVLTNLGRIARPIIRYRTGDFVRVIRQHHCACGRTEALLMGDVVRVTNGSFHTSLSELTTS
jgi:phenylacetate-CoA ligase